MQEIGFIKFPPENIYLKACSAGFSRSKCLVPDLRPELLSGCVKGQRLQWLETSFLENQMVSNTF